jgi:RNA polymerase sigma-70 factor (ECF subfamily)
VTLYNHHSKNNDELLDTALSIFMHESKASLLGFLSKLIPKEEAEEVAQEAYLKLYLLIKEKPSHHNYIDLLRGLRSMLTIIAKNLALSILRHKKVEGRYADSQLMLHVQATVSQNPNNHNAEEQAILEYENIQLIAAINRLPPICRQVFIQRKLLGKSHQEIANMLGISTKTVENHLTKGLLLCSKHMPKPKPKPKPKHMPEPQQNHLATSNLITKVAS